MGVMTLVAGKLCLHTVARIPCTVGSAMNTRFPVMVGCAMAFSAEQDRLIAGNFGTIMIYICFQIPTIVAVETAKI